MKACAVICRKATLRFSMLISSLPGANSRFPEHKIGFFVRFWPSRPSFSGFPSTKSGFLCFFCLRTPCFRAFRAQNRGFCALFDFGTPVFGRFEHKIGVFVLGKIGNWHREAKRGGVCRKRDLPANHRARFKNTNTS